MTLGPDATAHLILDLVLRVPTDSAIVDSRPMNDRKRIVICLDGTWQKSTSVSPETQNGISRGIIRVRMASTTSVSGVPTLT